MADTTGSSPAANCMEKLKSYVKTQKGFILAAEIVLSLIILICYAASYYGGYTAVAICEMVFCTVFLVIFMMELDKQFLVVNWVWSDFFRAVIGASLYIITSLICVIGGAGDGARIAGGILYRFCRALAVSQFMGWILMRTQPTWATWATVCVGQVFGLIAGILFAYDTYTIYLQIRTNRQHMAAPTDDRV